METESFISMFLLATRNFQDPQFAKKIISMMNQHPYFVPTLYDSVTPLKNIFAMTNMPDMVDTWMNIERNNRSIDQNYASGDFIARGKRKCKIDYFASWIKNQQVNFNLLSITLHIDEIIEQELFDEFMLVCTNFMNAVDPVYGEIGIEHSNNHKNNPINLRVRYPELNWISIFGKPYIELFGRDQLLSAPCYKVHEFGENIIGLQLTESICDDLSFEVRSAVKKHLGEEAFVEEGKGIRRHQVGLVPAFDFSEVLYDPSKPIVEPQILKRKR
ncbi:hypothetical protein [Paenibacillus wenxiniae]|uniref:Uncharacterized protein n=1 Tax=Paenibacillus wenxiniae TaxID=1636843 RepID=A0ABW4RLY5_9BACL